MIGLVKILTRDWWRAKLQSAIIYLMPHIDEYMYEARRNNGEYNELGQFVMLDELRAFSNAEIAGILDKVMRTLPPAYGNPPED